MLCAAHRNAIVAVLKDPIADANGKPFTIAIINAKRNVKIFVENMSKTCCINRRDAYNYS
jgi:hypothetical protein